MKRGMVLTLTLLLLAAMAVTNADAQQYVHTDTLEGHPGNYHRIAFKDNGTLISGSHDNTLRAWDVTTGTQRWEKDVGNWVYAVALPSHDSFFIAYGGEGNFKIRMRYSDDGDWRGEVTGHIGPITSLAFKPNSYRLASASSDSTVRIWDVGDNTNLRHVRTLRGHTGNVESVAWSPDGSILASGGRDGTVRLWNPHNGINFAVLRGHTSLVIHLAWSPDGSILASASHDNTIRLWNPDTHGTRRVLRDLDSTPSSLAFHPNGQTLAIGGGNNSLWNPNTGARKAKFIAGSQPVFSPNGQIIAAGGYGDIKLFRLLTVDVNEDGVVDFDDLVEVAFNYGWVQGDPDVRFAPDAGFADVNEDGKVDIDDLIAVAKAIDAAGAPALTQRDIKPGSLQASDVRRWIRDAKAANVDPAGIAALEQLLAALTRAEAPPPKETVLLANYPNPFNPETWIPYQLSEAAEVTVTIHASDGKLVRTLELGQMPAGVYQSRSRAAYWDGRNTQGEPVASGVYFYTLRAGDFEATRKMLIRK
ncbi:hypothetical protein C6495_01005 [Candidatus Poribacteria bacterium]|nr:MAG: hypothetical protein C6495_01005 [Candidatus Poribacteria bacterium]